MRQVPKVISAPGIVSPVIFQLSSPQTVLAISPSSRLEMGLLSCIDPAPPLKGCDDTGVSPPVEFEKLHDLPRHGERTLGDLGPLQDRVGQVQDFRDVAEIEKIVIVELAE